MILLGEARGPIFVADTLAGAAPFGEDLTVVVVGGDERQPVPNPLESIRRKGQRAKAAVPEPSASPQPHSRCFADVLQLRLPQNVEHVEATFRIAINIQHVSNI